MDPVNRDYYERESPGRTDYWRKMAAPRFRMKTFLDLLETLPKARLADLGCGSGELLGEVRARYPSTELCGIDSSEAQLAANRRREPGIEWRTFDLDRPDELPAELESKFDVVLASEIIEHMSRPEPLLRSALRLAAPAGSLLLSTQSGRVWETERRVGHLRHFSASDMEGLLNASGWSPSRIWNAGFPFHDWAKWAANRRPDAAMRGFGGEAYGLVQNAACFLLRLAFRLNSRIRGAQLFAVARKP